MNILAFDIGSYAIKLIEAKIERKKIVILETKHIVIDEVMPELGNPDLINAQLMIIQKLLFQYPPDSRVLFQLPLAYVTSRFLSLPVKSKRKAEQLIPFQLEDQLYISSDQLHTIEIFQLFDNRVDAQVYVTRKDHFQEYFSLLTLYNCFPHTLLTEPVAFHIFAHLSQIRAATCILDIGHTMTKAYFLFNSALVSHHYIYFGGKKITEIIAQTYNISLEDAKTYKHDNCFLLTDGQYEGVTEEQKEFALLMKSAFSDLIQDIKRWELGFQTKFGANVQQIHLTGGTAKIKNIDSFLAQQVQLPVTIFAQNFHIHSTYHKSFEGVDINDTAGIFATTCLSKTPAPSFLSKEFAPKGGKSLDFHSMAFVLWRTTVLCFIMSFMVFLDNILMKQELKNLETTLTKSLKSEPVLGLTKKERTSMLKDPEKIKNKILKKKTVIKQDVTMVMSAKKLASHWPLAQLSKGLQVSEGYFLVHYRSTPEGGQATFQYENQKAFEKLKESLKNVKITLNNSRHIEQDKHYVIEFSGYQ